VRHVRKKGVVLVGFHERKSRYVADMSVCPVLPPHVSAMLMPLRALISSMDAVETCPQIELACGDERDGPGAAPSGAPERRRPGRLRAFAAAAARRRAVVAAGQGPETVSACWMRMVQVLAYSLPEFGITMPFKPTDFTQVNPHINRVLVSRALQVAGCAAQRARDRLVLWPGQLHTANCHTGA
jgi:23S rRNA (uracil1939-C5)-methyltransferase